MLSGIGENGGSYTLNLQEPSLFAKVSEDINFAIWLL
jgi:hypothetical protein